MGHRPEEDQPGTEQDPRQQRSTDEARVPGQVVHGEQGERRQGDIDEVSLFDDLPRYASVWAIKPTSLLRLPYDEFVAFKAERMPLANDLLFALGRVLALRVRLAKARAQGRAFSPGG